MMLRPIPEEESDHGDNVSLGSVSAAADVSSTDDEYEDENGSNNLGGGGASSNRSVVSAASAVLAGDEDKTVAAADRDILLDSSSNNNNNKREGKGGSRRRCRRIGSSRKQKQQSRSIRRGRWSSWRSFVVMGVVLAAAVVIVLVILANTNTVSNEDGVFDGAGGRQPPAPTDTEADLTEMLNEILVPLDSKELSASESIVRDILQSARALAREWMLHRDLLRDEVLPDPTSVRFTQRYVLVLLFYSMQFNQNNYAGRLEDDMLVREASECDWTGIYCDEAIVETTNTTTITLNVVRRIHWGEVGAVGALPPELRALRYIQELNVSHNSLRGTIPYQWFETPPKPDNATTSSLVTEVEQNYYMPYLFLLDCSHNQKLSGILVSDLWLLPSMRFLYLSNNTLSGQFPTNEYWETRAVNASPYWEDIWLDKNQFSGAIPIWMLTRPQLTSLIVEYNRLSGPLPNVEQVPDSLLILDLSYNHLDGTIPASLFRGVSLTYLYLDHNNFTALDYDANDADIDKDINFKLAQVWLQSNQLEGEIPDNFALNFGELMDLKIQHNPYLTGSIINGCQGDNSTGRTVVMWPKLTRMQADCLNTSRANPVLCPCCTKCF